MITKKHTRKKVRLSVLLFLWIDTCLGFLLPRASTTCTLRFSFAVEHATGNDQNDDNEPFFDVLAGNVARCLIMSELKRASGFDGASTGWTSWVEDSSAHRLQCCMDALCLLAIPENPKADIKHLVERDEVQRWTRWMKASPAPIMMELSNEMRQAVSRHLEDAALEVLYESDDNDVMFLLSNVIYISLLL